MQPVTHLYGQIKPERYELILDINLKGFTYKATETIEFELVKASPSVTFHGVGLTIDVATIDGQQTSQSPIINDETQTVTFTFGEELAPGKHTLRLQFSGAIGESLHGFYRSRYDIDGQEHWLATTQFEAVHAREAFVCIDEPSAKAIFDLQLIVDKDLTALANTNVTKEEVDGQRKRLRYAPTPKMSTYLVAFIIGHFEAVEAKTKSGVTVRIFATPGKTEQLAFPLETAVRTLEFYEDYFAIPYPLPKLDMIAIPDFGAGAMENWGLVTYREVSLLLDPKQTSLGNRQRVAEVIVHELAHQWFGNLVTMAWWNDLWLNEGFATWIEGLAQDHLFPEWQIWTQFVAGDIDRAMELDALATTHPIEVQVDDPRQLDEIFDGISYAKGASIIHMIYHYLGEAAFREGLRHYLKRHAYSNTTTADLWAALGEASGEPVAEIIGPWTNQPGYPIISLDKGNISQQRFFASANEAAKAQDKTIWPVPLTARSDEGKLVHHLLRKASEPSQALNKISKLNPEQTGFYRVRYGLDAIKALTPKLTSGDLPPTDRFGIVSDVYAAAGAGLTDSTAALALTEALRQESDYTVWTAVAGGFGQLLALLPDGPLYNRGEAFGHWLVGPNTERLGWDARDDEPYFDRLMRALVLRQAVRFKDEATIKEARRRFEAQLAGKQPTDPDLRPAIYGAIARSGNTQDFETLLKLYRQETVPQEKNRLLNALCMFEDPKLTARILQLSLDPQTVRPQDMFMVTTWVLANRYSRKQGWDFLQHEWTGIVERHGGGGHVLDYFLQGVAAFMTTQQEADEVKAFFAKHPHPAITRPVAQAVEAITQRADWYARDAKAFETFFTDWSPK